MSKYTNYGVRLFLHVPLFFIYLISFLAPRDQQMWVFGSRAGDQFVDNSKHFFLYTSRNDTDIKAIWISHNRSLVNELRERGYHASYWLSPQGLYYSLRAGVYIYDSYINGINYWLSNGAIALNLWHGIPLKKIEADVKKGNSAKIYNAAGWRRFVVWYFFPWIFPGKRTIITAPSQEFVPIFSSAFSVSRNQIIVSGLPRNDALFTTDGEYLTNTEQAITEKMNRLTDEGLKHIVYMPTFRDSGGDPVTESGLDLSILNATLYEQNLHLWCKYHPAARLSADFSAHENVHLVPDSVDPHVLLQRTTSLITDYSSVYFDYLLLNQPVLFFAYDLEKYLSQDREMYFAYDTVTPGLICKTFTELLEGLQTLDAQVHTYDAERDRVRTQVHCGQPYDVQSGKLLEQIISLTKK